MSRSLGRPGIALDVLLVESATRPNLILAHTQLGELVGGPGLEPGWVTPHAPQTCASTSSASRPAGCSSTCPLRDSNP
jgi:hypothetical protein